MDGLQLISVATLAAIALEGVKWVVRMLKKVPTYDFPKLFYLLMLPIMEVLMHPVYEFLMTGAFGIEFDWLLLLRTAIASVISVVLYKNGIKPIKDYLPES